MGGKTAEEISSWLAGKFAERLGTTAAAIRVDKPIIRYPLDSVELTGISAELLEWLDLSVEPEELAAHRTIEALSEFLANESQRRTA